MPFTPGPCARDSSSRITRGPVFFCAGERPETLPEALAWPFVRVPLTWREVPRLVLLLAVVFLALGCASDQRRLVRSQNAHAYHAAVQVEECSKPKPAINCNETAKLLDAWKAHELVAIDSSARACNVKPSEPCATHGMFPDVLKALKGDRAKAREAGLR